MCCRMCDFCTMYIMICSIVVLSVIKNNKKKFRTWNFIYCVVWLLQFCDGDYAMYSIGYSYVKVKFWGRQNIFIILVYDQQVVNNLSSSAEVYVVLDEWLGYARLVGDSS